MTDSRQKIIDRELRRPGLRGPINAFCCHCIYDPHGKAGGWIQQVTNCTSYECPLYDVRPVNQPGKA